MIHFRTMIFLAYILLLPACSSNSETTEWLQPEFHYFEPKARVFFDSGRDDPDEVDVFQDGGLTVALDLAEVYWRCTWDVKHWVKEWTFGPALSLGMSGPGGESADSSAGASAAPVLLISAGGQIEFPVRDSENLIIVLDGGIAVGFSADEGFTDLNDVAYFVGFTVLGGARSKTMQGKLLKQ